MRFWNLATRREVARFEMKSVIHSITFAPNGSALFVFPTTHVGDYQGSPRFSWVGENGNENAEPDAMKGAQ